nr:phospholipase D-like domain-containing protein [Agrobacterium tumefaciens]
MDSGWSDELDIGMRERPETVLIVCPFIKKQTVERLIFAHCPRDLRVITRFDLNAFNAGVSDMDALSLLLRSGAKIRGVVGVHSKMYIFGGKRAIVTSANLTEAAMFQNKEFGFAADDHFIAAQCQNYFDRLWASTRHDLSQADIERWRQILAPYRVGTRDSISLPDFGETVNSTSPFVLEPPTDAPMQSFVKFFGRADNRVSLSMGIDEEVIRSGSHWACTYPSGKRPRQVRDGAIMFMARMVQARSDYIIYGRAISREHRPILDDATPADVSVRVWKENWPHYVRVHDPVFINGPLSAGVSMVDMMTELGPNSFAPTQRNLNAGSGGNLNPRRAIMRKPHMELTPQAYRWIFDRLEKSMMRYGALDLTDSRFDLPAAQDNSPDALATTPQLSMQSLED